MRILITGAGGMLGSELVKVLGDHEVVATRHADLDVADREAVLAAVRATAPDAVVHTAAWTDVDACELDPTRAFDVNVGGTRHVAEAARGVGASLCYLSTDFVFDGTKVGPYTEDDRPNPLSVYGRTKHAGETECPPEATIVRTSWMCGTGVRNFVPTVLRRARAGEVLRVVDDQRASPTVAADLAGLVARLVLERRAGLYHVTNQGTASRYELACAICELAGLHGVEIRPIATSELDPPLPAPRPANSVLANAALEAAGIPLLRHYRDALAPLVRGLGT